MIHAAAAGASCNAITLSLVYNIETCQENISTGEKQSAKCVCCDVSPHRATEGLCDMYTHLFTLSYECELVLLSSTATMLLGRTSINQRVFSERIIIGDLKRSSSPLIDSSLEVAPQATVSRLVPIDS